MENFQINDVHGDDKAMHITISGINKFSNTEIRETLEVAFMKKHFSNKEYDEEKQLNAILINNLTLLFTKLHRKEFLNYYGQAMQSIIQTTKGLTSENSEIEFISETALEYAKSMIQLLYKDYYDSFIK